MWSCELFCWRWCIFACSLKLDHADTARTLIQAFISNRLDYCNAALCGITDTLLGKLQSVQNAAARLLTLTGRREHTTPVLRQLHWIPVSRRIDFKLAVLITGTGSHHVLARQVQVGQWSEQRQTTTFCQCSDVRSATHEDETIGAAAGPRLWNSLPGPLRQSETLTTFKRQFKTFLFAD